MGTVVSELILSNPPQEHSPFVEGTKLQYAWDSVSLTTAMSCPQRYKLAILEGWQPKNPGVAIALCFGILIHAGIEHYHKAQSRGLNHTDSMNAALRHVMVKDDFRAPGVPLITQLPTDEDNEEAKAEAAEDDDGIDLRNSKVRTRYHLFRALVWYFEHYRNDPFRVVQLASGEPAVEHSFRVPIGRHLTNGTELLVSGHLDKLVDFNGQRFVTDVKTTKSMTSSWRKLFDLSHQMTGYTLGGKIGFEQPVAGAFIDGIALQVGGVKLQRFTTNRTESQLVEYMDLVQYVASLASLWHEHQYYPLNTSACFFCEFKEVCSQPPELRSGYLNYYFERVPAWNPLANR